MRARPPSSHLVGLEARPTWQGFLATFLLGEWFPWRPDRSGHGGDSATLAPPPSHSRDAAMHRAALTLALILPALDPAHAADFPKFEERVLDPMCGNVCYAVTLADVDGDGRQDVVAVTENRVLWYR